MSGSTPGDELWCLLFGLERDFMISTCTGSLAVIAAALVLTVNVEEVQGSVVVFNSQQGYDLVAPTFGIETTDYSLETFNGFYTSIIGGQDETAWSIDASSGVEGTFGEWITSAGLDESLTVNFQSDFVYSVGGIFHIVDDQSQSISGIIRLTLSDGTSYINQLDGGGGFAAFLSSETNITSLSVYAFGGGELESAGISRLSVGVIPAPATALAFVFGAAFRRRRC